MFNRSEIMKRSWQLSRVGYTASEALQMAWAEAKHKKAIEMKIRREAREYLYSRIPGSRRVQEKIDRRKVA